MQRDTSLCDIFIKKEVSVDQRSPTIKVIPAIQDPVQSSKKCAFKLTVALSDESRSGR